MWRGGKKRAADEPCGGSAAAPPSKKADVDVSRDSDGGIVVCELSKNRRVSVRRWQGKVVVDIREFYVKDGKTLPGKEVVQYESPNLSVGDILLISLQWKVMLDHIDDISEAVAENA